ncbi:MAG TPA: tetratricopeptide repeat protein, partial [Thermoanaerobaculia bacterium]
MDVLIVTAVKDERDIVQALEPDWQERSDESGFPYHVRQDPNGLRWALARAADMGSEFAANIATRLVATLKPRCLAMVGVCAGWREKVHLGDVIVAERLFRYDSGKLRAFREGAERKEDVFHDLRTYNLDPRWRQQAEDFPSSWTSTIRVVPRPLGYRAQETWMLFALDEQESGFGPPPRDRAERAQKCPDWTDVIARLEKRGLITLQGGLRLTDAGRQWVRELRDRYPDGYPGEPGEPKSHVAPMATGGRVVEDEELFPTIHRYVRKTLAAEMEGAAIGAVAEIEGVDHCLVVKGVQDYADPDKDDRFRSYAIEASYRFLAAFLRRQMGPPKRSAPFIVPQHETTSFTGREDEIESLGQTLLGDRGARVCTIAGLSGTGGIGKSAAAVHFASLHRSSFTDGVIGIRVDGKDVNTIAREFARNAGDVIDPDDDRDASMIMQSLFSGRDCLLIFDNAEDPGIRQLIPGGRSAVIITTRDRGLAILLEVPETARIDVPVLPVERALELLRKRLGERIDAEPDAARRLVAAIGGLPLALQIVAASLEMAPWRLLTSLADALELERERLSRLAIRSDPHLDVRISFNASLKLLRPDEIDFFACLSVCDADSFAVHSAAAAAGCAEETAVERLGYLYRLSLVNRPDTTANDRFVLHPLLRAFARELAEERFLAELAEERHAQYFIELVKSTDTKDARRSEMLASDIGETLTAASWLLSQSAPDYHYLTTLEPLLERHGYWREAIGIIARFLTAAEASGNSEAAIHLRIQQGKFLQLEGDFQGSLDILHPAFRTLNETAEVGPRVQAMFLNTYGGALQRLGRFEEAADALQRSRTIWEEIGDQRGLAMVLNSLGGVLQRLGRFEEAADALQRSRTISEEMGDQRSLAMVLNSLGGILQ